MSLTIVGRQFDRYGNLKEWWNNVTAEAFYRKAECFVEQYSQYIVDEVGLHVRAFPFTLPAPYPFLASGNYVNFLSSFIHTWITVIAG